LERGNLPSQSCLRNSCRLGSEFSVCGNVNFISLSKQQLKLPRFLILSSLSRNYLAPSTTPAHQPRYSIQISSYENHEHHTTLTMADRGADQSPYTNPIKKSSPTELDHQLAKLDAEIELEIKAIKKEAKAAKASSPARKQLADFWGISTPALTSDSEHHQTRPPLSASDMGMV